MKPLTRKPTAPKQDLTIQIQLQQKIEELEAEKDAEIQEQLLLSETFWRKEILTVLNRIATALESPESSPGESDEMVLDENGYGPEEPIPDPEPKLKQSTDSDF